MSPAHDRSGPTLARGTIRRCTNYIIRVSPMLKREVVRRCDIAYKRSDRVALLRVCVCVN